jgi:hypothetical protein
LVEVERGEGYEMPETGPDRRHDHWRRAISQGLIDDLDAERDPEELSRKVARLEAAAKGRLEIMPEVRAAIERAKRRL